MWKSIIIIGLALLGVSYFLADKPIVHTVETKDREGNTVRVTVNLFLGVGNTVNNNHKDAS